MKDLLPELVRQWRLCDPTYGQLPLVDRVRLFLQLNAAPLFANASTELGMAQMEFVEEMTWQAICQSGTHSNDEIDAARLTRKASEKSSNVKLPN